MKMTDTELTFRDRPINMNERGGRNWIYAKEPSGYWYKRRAVVSWVLLLFFILAPFIRVGGYPFILLDIASRKFIIFGAIFWAQDTFILALLMLSFIIFILLFTVIFGRIWCGWACPQTIFMEMVFRKVEYLIEGDYKTRHKLNNSPWSLNKIIKKFSKHSIFLVISFAMTNVFLMWFIGSEEWINLFHEPLSENLGSFGIIMLVSGFFYWVYSFFREQICTVVCPYGRMQGVLLDSNSIVVSYDYKRGEPRGVAKDGDCIDCHQCISVCPTGIDIRSGTQHECINCTACIDQCNKIMHVTGKPPGLIRYASANSIKQEKYRIWNPRNRAYSAVLLLIFSFFMFTLYSRPAIETTILRTPGLLYQNAEDGRISNVYNIKIVNKTHNTLDLDLRILSHDGEIKLAGSKMVVKDQNKYESTFLLYLPLEGLQGDKTKVEFGIFHEDKKLETLKLTFIGP